MVNPIQKPFSRQRNGSIIHTSMIKGNIKENPLKILFLAAEADPFVKVGGLGDVAGSLPAAIKALPQDPDIRVAIPFYPGIKNQNLSISALGNFSISHRSGPILADVYQVLDFVVPLYLVDGDPIAGSLQVYSGDNKLDGIKLTFFSLACLEMVKMLDWKPDIIHANDWHTTAAVYKLWISKRDRSYFQGTKTLLTVHNLPFLGQGAENSFQAYGLPRAHMSPLPDWAQHLPLPLGLLSADLINTVSPGYAKEMLTVEFGADLEDYLQTRSDDLRGILNGIDQDIWNPEKDPYLPYTYGQKTISDRNKNKIALLRELELPVKPEIPLLAMINRMDYQKGVDLVPDALRHISHLDWQAVILGTGELDLENEARLLDQEFKQVISEIKFDGALAHRIYGGSDLILIPSRYEPCGLTQMIGMRYGCVPLARATGGLRDTIIDYQQDPPKSTGFLFTKANPIDLAETISAALQIYNDKRRWQGLQRRGMKKDFSWQSSAEEYYNLYDELLFSN